VYSEISNACYEARRMLSHTWATKSYHVACAYLI